MAPSRAHVFVSGHFLTRTPMTTPTPADDFELELARAFGAAPTTPSRSTHVRSTPDLHRIRDLPRRVWSEAADLDRLVSLLTQRLRTGLPVPDGTPERDVPRALLGTQASALRDLHDRGGCFAPIDTGGGKTLLSLMAAEVMQAERAVLIAPKELEKAHMAYRRRVAPYWRVRPLAFVSYQVLPHQPDLLNELNPDLLILDECHLVKSTGSARWKHIRAWRKRNPDVPVMAMSGSMAERSCLTFAHLLRLCLKRAAPLPHDRDELIEWCQALDVKPPFGERVEVGALLELGDETAEDPTPIAQARARFSGRLLNTPGVVGTAGDLPSVGLTIVEKAWKAPQPVVRLVDQMRKDWCVPNGDPIESPFDVWRHERSMSCGLWYRWRDPAPRDWLEARKAWAGVCREVLEHSQKLRCPMDVANAIDAGSPRGAGELERWREIRSSFTPVTVHEWIDDSTLNYAAEWLERTQGLCWVWHVGFAQRLTELTGVPYFREEGRDPRGVLAEEHDGPAILSTHSCHKGLNMQAWSENLVICPPTVNYLWHQLLSRTHRRGQLENVTCEVLLRLEGDILGYQQAHQDAVYASQMLANPQRLCLATRIEVQHVDR